MRFRSGDELVSMDVVSPGTDLLVVTDEGFGKRTDPDLFAKKGRGGLGVRAVRVNEQRGRVVGALLVAPDAEVLLISAQGVIIRTLVGSISQQGRDASGVRVMNLGAGDHVAAVARILSETDEVMSAEADEGATDLDPGQDPPPAR